MLFNETNSMVLCVFPQLVQQMKSIFNRTNKLLSLFLIYILQTFSNIICLTHSQHILYLFLIQAKLLHAVRTKKKETEPHHCLSKHQDHPILHVPWTITKDYFWIYKHTLQFCRKASKTPPSLSKTLINFLDLKSFVVVKNIISNLPDFYLYCSHLFAIIINILIL